MAVAEDFHLNFLITELICPIKILSWIYELRLFFCY